MKFRHIESINELRRLSRHWDDLWTRSSSTLPTHRAELVAQWVEHFAHRRPFHALAVEDNGQFVAALPLVIEKKFGLKVGTLTSNCWSDCGALLLDRECDGASAMQEMSEGAQSLGCPLLMFDGVNLEEKLWSNWLDANTPHNMPASKQKYRIGVVDITHDWDAYVKAWSSNHRRAMKKLAKASRVDGDARLESHTGLQPDHLEELLHAAFEIEDRGWKGREGTSVLRTPGAFDFFLRQAQQLSSWNAFELYFLRFQDQYTAFDFCYSAKGVLSSHKIGYDEQFRNYGPFQVLRAMQLEKFFADPSRRLLDTLGIMGESNAKWSTRYIQSSRLITPTNALGRFALAGYRHVWPTVKSVLRRHEEEPRPYEPGAARLLKSQSHDASNENSEPALATV